MPKKPRVDYIDEYTFDVELHAPLSDIEALEAGLPDIEKALHHYFKEVRPGKRGDEHELHMSDLGKCKRAVWYRRNGAEATMAPVRLSMEHGFWVEDGLGKILNCLEHQGWTVTHGGTSEADWGHGSITGHPDSIAKKGRVGIIFEDKSRRYITVDEWDYPRIDHRLQAATYAKAHGCDYFGIAQWCNSNCKVKVVFFEVAPWLPIVQALYEEFSVDTEKGAPLPDPSYPKMPYKPCNYCDYKQCEFNAKKEEAF